MKNIKKIIISLFIFLILIIPTLSFAADTPLVPCNNSATNPCDFNALMALVNTVIHFILFDMVIPIAAIVFAYAGFMMVTAGDESAHARTQAKKIFFNAVIGLILAVAAFLIVQTILSILGYKGSWLGFNPLNVI